MKIFIYYSLSGNGDKIANDLMQKGIDIRKVLLEKDMPKSKTGSLLKGGFLASINYKSKLKDFNDNIDSYDEVIIGSPIWNSRLSSPINTVLSKLDLTNKKVTFILYSASGKDNKAMEKIKKLYPEANVINLCEPLKNDFSDKLSNI
jgi:flavorubredoxin